MKKLYVELTILEQVNHISDKLILTHSQEVVLHFTAPDTGWDVLARVIVTNSYSISFDPLTRKSMNMHQIVATFSNNADLPLLFWGRSELKAGLIVQFEHEPVGFKVAVKPLLMNTKQRDHKVSTIDTLVSNANRALRKSVGA